MGIVRADKVDIAVKSMGERNPLRRLGGGNRNAQDPPATKMPTSVHRALVKLKMSVSGHPKIKFVAVLKKIDGLLSKTSRRG